MQIASMHNTRIEAQIELGKQRGELLKVPIEGPATYLICCSARSVPLRLTPPVLNEICTGGHADV